ncbi:hypothetical protein ACS0TY_014703 [Phlomoides rotata]
MVYNQKEINANGGGSDFESAVVGPKDKEVNANGVALDAQTGSWGLGGESLVTYKRRRFAKVTESGKISDDSVSQPGEKSVKHPHDLAECSQKELDALSTSSSDCLLKARQKYYFGEYMSVTG